MFTGIIEAVGILRSIERERTNLHFTFSCPFTSELKIDQSLAHNGCCLTIVDIERDRYRVTAIEETLLKTNAIDWKLGTKVNLERCTSMNGRLDGHIVQGHVDQTGNIKSINSLDGSYWITVEYEEDQFTTVPQGSIALNGVSLTVARSAPGEFSVAIIPYTWDFTNMHTLKEGDRVNLEFDIIGKYVARMMRKGYVN